MTSPAPPTELPVFPLSGVLLLPGMPLPLNIFEPRYRHMVADAMEGARHIGMIQPVVPRQDNRLPPEVTPENPELFPVGCAGRILFSDKAPDGRYQIQLLGVTRFRVVEELPLLNGYRRVRADYDPFSDDLKDSGNKLDTGDVVEALRIYARGIGIVMQEESLRAFPPQELINGMSMSLPFTPGEKQALLEASGLEKRRELLLSLLRMGLENQPDEPHLPPKVN